VIGRLIARVFKRQNGAQHAGALSMTAAFPARLKLDAAAVLAVLPPTAYEPRGSFTVTIAGESVTIPERIYNSEPRLARSLTEAQQLILNCVYSRHHDGFVRQAHVGAILGCRVEWTAPFIARLIGEYVLPIIEDIWSALSDDTAEREKVTSLRA